MNSIFLEKVREGVLPGPHRLRLAPLGGGETWVSICREDWDIEIIDRVGTYELRLWLHREKRGGELEWTFRLVQGKKAVLTAAICRNNGMMEVTWFGWAGCSRSSWAYSGYSRLSEYIEKEIVQKQPRNENGESMLWVSIFLRHLVKLIQH